MSSQAAAEKKAFFAALLPLDLGEDESVEDRGARGSREFLRSTNRPAGPRRRACGEGGNSRSRPLGLATRDITETKNDRESRTAVPQRKSPNSLTLRRSTSAAEAGTSRAAQDSLGQGSNSLALSFPAARVQGVKRPHRGESASTVLAMLQAAPRANRMATIPRALGKRKREARIELVAESSRIFAGLIFFFFPNDDTNVARRIRISKALQYGATWYREWQGNVTHVIVDAGIDYEGLKKYLNEVDISKAIIVNDKYIPDCIAFQTLLRPEQSSYRIKGDDAAERLGSKAAAIHRPASPQLKPDRRLRIEEKTPSRSSQSQINTCDSSLETVTEQPAYDALMAETVKEARDLRHLRLDSDESSSSELDRGDSSDAEPERPGKTARKLMKKSENTWQENFQCMQRHTGVATLENPNARTIDLLQKLCDYYDRTQDNWRTTVYRKAIASLRKQTQKVVTKDDALRLPFVGDSVASKIEEIVFTDSLRRLENVQSGPRDAVLQRFLRIYGVGFSAASRWVEKGHRTVSDLLEHERLTTNQKIGIEHLDDFNARIPRAEVETHGNLVKNALLEIDPSFQMMIMGSYRRGAATSGDIDIIVTKPGGSINHIREVVVEELVPKLFSAGFLKVGLSTASKATGSKWHGASCLADSMVWRRIDFLLVPWEELGAALLYFTGNDIFNRSLRLLASKKGMRLNQHGLFRDVMRGNDRKKVTEGELVESRSEKRILEVLGVSYRPPKHRNA